MKRLVVIVGALAAVIVVAVIAVFVFVLGNIDSLVKEVMEDEGSRVAGVPVSVAEVKIDLFDGRGAISGLTVANPPGFKSDNAVSLGSISVQVDTGSVGESVIVINEIAVDQPVVTYELATGGNNIDIIATNVGKSSGGSQSAPAQPAEGTTAEGEGGDVKLIIENLYVRGGRVEVAAAILEGKPLEAELPDIHLRDIGRESGGATPDEVAAQVMAAMTAAASKAAAEIGVGKTLDSLKEDLEGMSEENAEKALQDAGETLKRLFGD